MNTTQVFVNHKVASRIAIEKRIAGKVIDGMLALGFSASVNDGEEFTLDDSKDRSEILAHMFHTEEDTLHFLRSVGKDELDSKFVTFIYGNDGYDVVADHSHDERVNKIVADAEKEVLADDGTLEHRLQKQVELLQLSQSALMAKLAKVQKLAASRLKRMKSAQHLCAEYKEHYENLLAEES